MAAERMPPAEPSTLSRLLSAATGQLLRQPRLVLSIALAVAFLSVAITAARLGMRTSRLDLLNPDSGYNRLWIEYIEEFGDEDDAVIVVEGDSRSSVIAALDDLSQQLARHSHLFHAVLHEVDLSKIRSKGLHYLTPEELVEVDRFVRDTEPIVQGQWSWLNVNRQVQLLAAGLDSAAPGSPAEAQLLAQAEPLSTSLRQALLTSEEYQTPWPAMPASVATLSDLGNRYLLTNEGRLGFILLRLAPGKPGFAAGTEAIDALRELIQQTSLRHPQGKIGLTGLPVMENDEMRASQRATLRASLLSLFGVALLFIAGFGNLRHPLLTVASLLLAMAWSFGYLTLAVGHLNILSMAFGVVLIGLGIDFGVHYLARYLQLRPETNSTSEALRRTSGSIGPGILTGAITTAIAFFTAAVSEFTGVAELGLIAGGGILLCAVAALVVLPAMILMSDEKSSKPLPKPLDCAGWLLPIFDRRGPRLALGIGSALATVAAAAGLQHLWYDHNLLNLQPRGLESVELERKLLSESDQSVWFALSIAESREELLAKKEQFLALDSVERTEEIASLLTTDQETKAPLIRDIHGRLANLPERPAQIGIEPPELLGQSLAGLQQRLATRIPRSPALRSLQEARQLLRGMPVERCYAQLTRFQQQMAGDLLSRMHALREISNPAPPQLEDLPEGLVTRFVGKSQRYLLKIYARGNIWDMDALQQFVQDVRGVDPRATGKPLQTFEASHQMQRSYIQAACLSLVAVAFVLVLDFNSIRFTLLAMLPLVLGMVQMFGIMGWLNIPLNPANMIVLPLILGIGIDDGVHIVHDFRNQRGRYRISSSTATSVLVTSLTTMIGFGSLMIAMHQGLQSLGRVLTIGVSCCLFTSLVVLPLLLTWWTRNKAEEENSTGHVADSSAPEAEDTEAQREQLLVDAIAERQRRRQQKWMLDPIDENAEQTRRAA